MARSDSTWNIRQAFKAAHERVNTLRGTMANLAKGRRHAGIKGGGTRMAQAYAKRAI